MSKPRRKPKRAGHANDTAPSAKEIVAKDLAKIKARHRYTTEDVEGVGLAAMFNVRKMQMGLVTESECLAAIVAAIDCEVQP